VSSLADYVIRHADDNLVLSQRLAEYISRAPELEEDLAIANTALDHLGVATHLLDYAAGMVDVTADGLAFLRNERELTNLLLVEQPNTDFAHIIVRQFLFDAYQRELWDALSRSTDNTIAGIAAKASKEAAYHLRHSRGWLVRLGDGTPESHDRIERALAALWRFVDEMFEADALDDEMSTTGAGVSPAALRTAWSACVDDALAEATLSRGPDQPQRRGGRSGFHTEHLGHLLTEMQWMQRSYPGLVW
jgi:ring-1,2-phenylacetyl-CoA epoxidase subunit PaaC